MSSYSFPLDEALTYLKDLISIPSVSGEEQAIGIYLEDKLRGFGADLESAVKIAFPSVHISPAPLLALTF